MKKVLVALALISACYACGGSSENKEEQKPISNSDNNANNQIGGGTNDSASQANNAPPATNTASLDGKALIDKSTCRACHNEEKKVVGPAYVDVAAKYSDKDVQYLSEKIIKGGKGVWGDVMMPPNNVSPADAEAMVRYILSLKK